MMQAHFAMFARYNAWANRRIYERAAALPDADYRADGGAFFASVHGTLNHLLVADRIWMHRFTCEGETYAQLGLVLYDDLAGLRAAREAEDARIVAWIDTLEAETLEGSFTYRTIVDPRDVTQPLAAALAHFFNHQTHHRGQAHALLTALGGRDAAPSLDLVLFQRETGIGLAETERAAVGAGAGAWAGDAHRRIAGRCNCGAVTFVATGPFRPAKACHCKTCRRQSGHFIAATQIDRGGLEISGAESLSWHSASARARRGFCRTCGAHLFWEPTGSDRISIFMGCLDEPTGIRLADHIFVAEKGDYYDIDDGLPHSLESDRPKR